MNFFYDASNKPAIVEYNGTKYAYVHNLQGDIVAILDNKGTAVVQYQYDAWGRPIGKTGSTAGTLGTVQPFRYRGYVYDEETGLYYLRSRYYSAVCARFVNADVLYTGNLYAYCRNSPIKNRDDNGYFMYAAFDDCGYGNPMASLTGTMCHGGGASVGSNTYTYAGVMQGATDDDGRAKQVDEALDVISVCVGIPFIAFASTAIATSVSIGFAFAAEAFAKQALALNLGKDVAYGIKAVTILCGTVIGSEAQGTFNETVFKQEVELLDYGKESISAIVLAISPIDLPWKLEYVMNAIKAIFENDLIPAK